MDEQETSSADVQKTQETSSASKSREKEGDFGRKRKQNQVALVLEHYLQFKKSQTEKIIARIQEEAVDREE
ncbi:hypothetical protein ABZP36_002689, partial [Zizania latifolia]